MKGLKMAIKFTIPGRLDGLNEYTRVNRANAYKGNTVKQRNQKVVRIAILQAKLNSVDKYPVRLKINWYEKNAKRDVDNIIFAQKFILDALVESGILENDSQKYVKGIYHDVSVDKNNPRIEVEIIEESERYEKSLKR